MDCDRIKELETDLSESEGRLMKADADIKAELRLHSEILLRILNSEQFYDPVRKHFIKELKRSQSCKQCDNPT